MAHLEGQTLGHYRLLSLIGRGGMGEVYLAEDDEHADDAAPRQVAVKVVRVSDTSFSTDAEALRIFREGRFLLELSHPHILPVYHDGIQDDLLFLVMPYMPNGSLADAIHAQLQLRLELPVSLERVTDYISQIAEALQYTHDRSIVHRDVKPGNVLVEVKPDGQWHLFLADFGIARNVETTGHEEGWRGTVPYMAPEQFRGQMSPAADQYALAVVAFQLLSGQVPFAMTPPAVRTLNPDIPVAVENVLLQGLALRPEDRYASVTAFATALREAVSVAAATAAEAKARGDDLSAEKRYDEALSAYLRATTLEPGDAIFWFEQGRALGSLKRYDEALAAFDRALTLDPKNSDIWDNKGSALAYLKRRDEALAAFEQALSLDPRRSHTWYNKGNILAGLKRYNEALDAFEQALSLDPKYENLAVAWNNKGNVLARLKRYEEALAAIDDALGLDAQYAAAWGNKGNILARLKRYDEALAAVEQALTLDPKDTDAWNNKGAILSHLKRYEEAAEAYNRVLKLNPSNTFARRNRAMSHLATLARQAEIRDTERLAKEQAVNAARSAVDHDPKSADAWCDLGEALNALKQYVRADDALDRAIALDPRLAKAWANKGVALFGLDEYEDAVGAYDRALEVEADNAEIWANKAVVLFRLMRYEDAATTYEHAMALDPDYGGTAEMPAVKAPITVLDENLTHDENLAHDE